MVKCQICGMLKTIFCIEKTQRPVQLTLSVR